MSNLACSLIAASAAITFLLGFAHLRLTYFSKAFSPRDAAVEAGLKAVSPRISSQTTMWRAQIGFHASHSLGVMLFGIVWGYLALAQPAFFFAAHFLVGLGAVVLLSYLLLAKLYWFVVPLAGIGLATVCYLAGVVAAYS